MSLNEPPGRGYALKPEVPSQSQSLSGTPPLMMLLIACALWLVVGWVLALIGSIKFHSPEFLAHTAWLTYGRVRPAMMHTLLYGFCIPAGVGVCTMILARLGRTAIAGGWVLGCGGLFWNAGVAAGVYGILAGDGTGFENLEHPLYAAVFLFLGYLLMALSGAMTFHQRQNRVLFPSQWFILTALFWFAWIYSTAHLLLNVYEIRGMAQAVIAWWYSGNLQVVWMWLVGLAVLFYMVTSITGREFQNRSLALFIYWMLILFGTWSGIPATAPVPSWIPSASTVSTVLLVLPLLAVIIALRATLAGQFRLLSGHTGLRFARFAILALLAAGSLQIVTAFISIAQLLNFTWLTPGRLMLNNYGFLVMVLFGAIYFLVESSFELAWPAPKLVRVHFYLAATGVLLLALPLVAGGILEGLKLQTPALPFVSVSRLTLHFLRISTIGDLLLLAGHALLLVNLAALAWRVFHAPVRSAYRSATAELFPAAEVRS